MTRDSSFTGEVTTADEFETMLGQLLRAATRNDVDPRGAWVPHSGDEIPRNWEVLVVELADEPTE